MSKAFRTKNEASYTEGREAFLRGEVSFGQDVEVPEWERGWKDVAREVARREVWKKVGYREGLNGHRFIPPKDHTYCDAYTSGFNAGSSIRTV